MAPSPTISMVEIPQLHEEVQEVTEGKLTHVPNIPSEIGEDEFEASEFSAPIFPSLPDFSSFFTLTG